MVLESTIICVDNSEYTRNGDYLPTRLQAQQVPKAVPVRRDSHSVNRINTVPNFYIQVVHLGIAVPVYTESHPVVTIPVSDKIFFI